MKSYQIPEPLLVDLILYHLDGVQDDDTARRIRDGLQAKLDALARRDLYTKSKAAPTPEEREAARQQYLDEIGIPDAFRWGPEGPDTQK